MSFNPVALESFSGHVTPPPPPPEEPKRLSVPLALLRQRPHRPSRPGRETPRARSGGSLQPGRPSHSPGDRVCSPQACQRLKGRPPPDAPRPSAENTLLCHHGGRGRFEKTVTLIVSGGGGAARRLHSNRPAFSRPRRRRLHRPRVRWEAPCCFRDRGSPESRRGDKGAPGFAPPPCVREAGLGRTGPGQGGEGSWRLPQPGAQLTPDL